MILLHSSLETAGYKSQSKTRLNIKGLIVA